MDSFSKSLKKIIAIAPEHKYYLPVAFVCFAWFGILAYLVHSKQTLELDNYMYKNFQVLSDITGLEFWRTITYLGDVLFVVPVVLFISYFMWVRQQLTHLFFFLISVVGGGLLGYACKAIISSDRPGNLLVWLDSHYSFPSGHTIVAFTLYVALVFLWHKHISHWPRFKKNLLILGIGLLVALLSISRLALGVHWFTDVVGGIFLGLGWILFIFSFYRERWS